MGFELAWSSCLLLGGPHQVIWDWSGPGSGAQGCILEPDRCPARWGAGPGRNGELSGLSGGGPFSATGNLSK